MWRSSTLLTTPTSACRTSPSRTSTCYSTGSLTSCGPKRPMSKWASCIARTRARTTWRIRTSMRSCSKRRWSKCPYLTCSPPPSRASTSRPNNLTHRLKIHPSINPPIVSLQPLPPSPIQHPCYHLPKTPKLPRFRSLTPRAAPRGGVGL